MPEIAKINHRIWFGSNLPEHYQGNLIALKELNPDYELCLHSDPESMTDEEWVALTAFCEKNTITLRSVREEQIPAKEHILKELDDSRNSELSIAKKRLAYVRASDITRMAVIYHYGGIYTDTDLLPKAGFGTLEASEGFLQTYYNLTSPPYVETEKGVFVKRVEYDFMAAVAGNRFYEVALGIIDIHYKALEPASNLWRFADDNAIGSKGVYDLTGWATVHAYNHLLQNGGIADLKATYLDTSEFYKSQYDRSWQSASSANNLNSLFFAQKTRQLAEDQLKADATRLKEKRFIAFPYDEYTLDSRQAQQSTSEVIVVPMSTLAMVLLKPLLDDEMASVTMLGNLALISSLIDGLAESQTQARSLGQNDNKEDGKATPPPPSPSI